MDIKQIRSKTTVWELRLIDGPNMSNLGRRDRRLFGTIASIDELHDMVGDFAESLGVKIEAFVSNFEGEILEYVHRTGMSTDGYLINPGGLTTTSEGLRHALQETRTPVIEVHFHNIAASGQNSLFTPTVIGICMGLRQYSYLAAILGLVLALDDDSFLGEGDSETNRREGVPYTFTTSAGQR